MSNNNSFQKQYKTVKELLDKAKEANHHRITEFNIHNRSLDKKAKGSFGQIVEEGIFNYPINSKAEADFENLGVELKVTGLKKLKNNQLAIKERLVLNIINYFDEANVDFEHSSFWQKNKQLLIMFYLYDYEQEDANYMIIDSILHTFSPKDLEIIKADWKIIHDKIVKGEAENISEADTMYLGACVKGADAVSSYRSQPNSTVMARQRAYCLKASYMNSIVNALFEKKTYSEIVGYDEIQNNTFEYIINDKLSKFLGMSEEELLKHFNVNKSSKGRFNLLCAKMLGIDGFINQSDEFVKANIELKTIRVEENQIIKEHMSFPHFIYEDIVNQTFEESDIYNKFYSTKFLFVVFQKSNGAYRFKGTLLWNMPLSDIENYVQPVFELTKETIASGNIVKSIQNGTYKTNFPGITFNKICHVRPHDIKGINKTNKGLTLPVPDKLTKLTKYTKHCFWLDRHYILNILKDKNLIK